MVVAFCGHSNYVKNEKDENRVLEFLESEVENTKCDFFLGEYGNFDSFGYCCAKKFKEKHPDSKLIFITPYIYPDYQKISLDYKDKFDDIIYPGLEKTPLRYAISHRNKWIVQQADVIITYVVRKYGGAYSMYKYANTKGKKIYNISDAKID